MYDDVTKVSLLISITLSHRQFRLIVSSSLLTKKRLTVQFLSLGKRYKPMLSKFLPCALLFFSHTFFKLVTCFRSLTISIRGSKQIPRISMQSIAWSSQPLLSHHAHAILG